MSYISAIRKHNDVLVWERSKAGRELKLFRAPYYFYIKDPKGEYRSIYGDALTRLDFDTADEFNQARNQCDSRGIEMFEAGIPPELKLLSEKYYNVEAPNLHVTFLDIEVDYNLDLGFSSVDNPYAPINSIALYHNWSNRMVVYAIPPKEYTGTRDVEEIKRQLHEMAPLPDDIEIEIHFCKHEKQLLMYVLEEIKDSDVISGWNSDFFDVPYIGKRLELLGKKYLQKLSFDGANNPRWRVVEAYNREMTTLDISGRSSVDYMVLFKKYEMAERPSYKLEAIADEMLPDLPKLEYEGSLAELYRNDFLYFIRYNLRDTEILKGFEDRLGYVDLANQMYHLSTGLFDHVTGTLKLAELATINFCHHELDGTVVNDLHVDEDENGKIQGATVLLPQIGLHENVGSVDINSLYPSAIRSLNISPETLRGQFVEKVAACEEIAANSDAMLTLVLEENGEALTLSAKKWRQELKKLKWAVSGYGTVFDQNMKGIIPSILESWYATRKKFQRLKNEAKEKGDKLKTTYYDKLQYVYKIKLNSFYGALTNKYFRFYDLRMGESTTGTGRMILLHQCAEVCSVLDGQYKKTDVTITDKDDNLHFGYSNKWSVIYGDTDSTYFKTHTDNVADAIRVADRVGELVNKSFPKFMRDTFLCNEEFDDIIQTGREIVSDRGIFVDKKRYFLHIIDDDGDTVDKIKVMGLDTKKTTLPKEVSKVLNSYIERFLKGEGWNDISNDIVDFKEQIRTTTDLMSIGLPKGVKKVEEYTRNYEVYGEGTRLPGHVAASIFYNLCLEHFKDKQSLPIVSGMKIKVFYLNRKYGKFKSIAIPVDIEQVPSWFETEFTINRDMHIERLVDKPLGNIIKAVGMDVPSKQSLFTSLVLEF